VTIYLDHNATTPFLPEARFFIQEGPPVTSFAAGCEK